MSHSYGKDKCVNPVGLNRKRREEHVTQEEPFPQDRQLNTSFAFLFKDFIVVQAKSKAMLRPRKLLGNALIFKYILTYVKHDFTGSYTLSTNVSNDAFS